MRNKIKKIFVILISILLMLNIPLYSKAFSFEDVIQSGKDFENAAQSSQAAMPAESELQAISQTVSSVLLTIAVGVTLISVVMMGINFTIQSVEDKAKIKEAMVPWIIGIFVTFGAFGIWKITMGIFYTLL